MSEAKELKCEHIYRLMGADICPLCGRDTHEINWQAVAKENKEWIKKNPDAWRNVGWWSI